MQESRGLKGLLMGQLDSRSTDAGTRVLATAESLKKIAGELQSDELSRGAASLATRGAQSLERVGAYLKEADGDRLVTDAERFGRSRPWAVAMTGFALGVAGSRMLKASAAQRRLGNTADSYVGNPDFGGTRNLGSQGGFGSSGGLGGAAGFGSSGGFGSTSAAPNVGSTSAAKTTSTGFGYAASREGENNDSLNSADRELL